MKSLGDQGIFDEDNTNTRNLEVVKDKLMYNTMDVPDHKTWSWADEKKIPSPQKSQESLIIQSISGLKYVFDRINVSVLRIGDKHSHKIQQELTDYIS